MLPAPSPDARPAAAPAPRVLVLGRAKTGTTVISKAIQHSIPGASYHLEPKQAAFFDGLHWTRASNGTVVKIIFEHWEDRAAEREDLIHDRRTLQFSHRVAIVRDPRDEIISRLYYYILPFISRFGYDREQVGQWLEVLRKKERAPGEISVLEMVRRLRAITGRPVAEVPGGLEVYGEFLRRGADRLHVVRYEDFMLGRVAALEEYLGVTLSAVRDVGDLGWTRRSAAADNWRRLFTAEDVAHYREALAGPMARLGYTDWRLERPERLDPDAGSRYVEALVAKALEG